ncbi:tail fiber assembly protein [Xenorhabdus sp. CUL]|nr:tail fiber assembly protein [Xenorhabdus sp. CUL]
MKYFKNDKNAVYAYAADGSQDEIIDGNLLPITEAEAMTIVNPPPTPEQLQEQAEYQKRYRLSQAANAITPLQYAVDLDMATDGELAALTAWKRYCVLLNRVDCSAAPDIDWPKAPE